VPTGQTEAGSAGEQPAEGYPAGSRRNAREAGSGRKSHPPLSRTRAGVPETFPCLRKLTQKVSYSKRTSVRFQVNQHTSSSQGMGQKTLRLEWRSPGCCSTPSEHVSEETGCLSSRAGTPPALFSCLQEVFALPCAGRRSMAYGHRETCFPSVLPCRFVVSSGQNNQTGNKRILVLEYLVVICCNSYGQPARHLGTSLSMSCVRLEQPAKRRPPRRGV
jgi:hypothetical protein